MALMFRRSTMRWRCIVAVAMLATGSGASARILRTKSSPSETWDPWFPLTIGGGVEFETNSDQSQYEFPFLLEYNFTETLKLTVEPIVTHIAAKAKDVHTLTGTGDLETSLEYEFLRQRRYQPALTAEAMIRWPTHTDRDIGISGRDYSLGLLASKDLVFFNLDLSALYTLGGARQGQNTLEVALAAEVPLNHFFDLEAEVVHAFGAGGIRGQPGTISGVGTEATGSDLTQGTFGVAWHISKRLKIEQGAIFQGDGTWQIVFAWEWSFSGD